VIKRVIFVWKTGNFLDFAKVGPVEWKLGWTGRVVVGNCPGRFSVPVRPCSGMLEFGHPAVGIIRNAK